MIEAKDIATDRGSSQNARIIKMLKEFEKEIAKLLKIKYVCGVGNGTDALEIAMLSAKQLMLRKDQSIIFHVQLSIKNTLDGKNYSAHNMIYPSLYHSNHQKDLDIGIRK